MTNEIFEAERMVIIKSVKDIDSLEWVEYFIDNWEKFMKKQSKLLVLAGIHGGSCGEIGPKDEYLFNDIKQQIERLEKVKAKDITNQNIEIILVDVGEFYDMSTDQLKESQLVETVKKHEPTIISLAFCHTSNSILNDILRSVGIYSKMILFQDRFKITNGGVLTLDKEQSELIEEVSMHPEKNVIIWGSWGTGKTLLLAEALAIKISYYRRKGVTMKVIVSSYQSDSINAPLMHDLQNYYLSHLQHEKFVQFIDFKSLCNGL